MFYILVLDREGNVATETEERDYEDFIIKCYNFREDASLDQLRIFYIGSDGQRHNLHTQVVEEMIEIWLEPDFMFALGYPLQQFS